MQDDRRNFLKKVGGVGAAVAAVTTIKPPVTVAAASADLRLPGSGQEVKYALELDGSFAGWLASAEGGAAVGEVVEETDPTNDGAAEGHVIKKHIAGVKYEDITVNCGTGMSKAFYEWIKASFDRKSTRKDGAIHAADFDSNIISTLDFHQALISEIGFPALDASSKDAAKMTLKFKPETTRHRFTVGSLVASEKQKQKQWLTSNFRLRIDGLEKACSKVNKIDALTIKQSFVPADDGRVDQKEPGKLEFPNLKLSLSEGQSDDFYQWHEDFVIKGNNSDKEERAGKLEFLDPANKPLFTLSLSNLGIFKVAPEKTEAGSENIRRVKAEMYCEDISFKFGDASWA